MELKFAKLYSVSLILVLIVSGFQVRYYKLHNKYEMALKGEVQQIEKLVNNSLGIIDSVIDDGYISEDKLTFFHNELSQILWSLDHLAFQEHYFAPRPKYRIMIRDLYLEIENMKNVEVNSEFEYRLKEIRVILKELDNNLEVLSRKEKKEFFKDLKYIIYIE